MKMRQNESEWEIYGSREYKKERMANESKMLFEFIF